jgi:hypothetical protein
MTWRQGRSGCAELSNKALRMAESWEANLGGLRPRAIW